MAVVLWLLTRGGNVRRQARALRLMVGTMVALLVMVSVSVAERRADRVAVQRAVDGLLGGLGLNVACETAWADPVVAQV